METGMMDLRKLEEQLEEVTRKTALNEKKNILVSISHIATCQGVVQPITEIGTLCEKYNVPFLVDGCQSIGQIPVDMGKSKITAITGILKANM